MGYPRRIAVASDARDVAQSRIESVIAGDVCNDAYVGMWCRICNTMERGVSDMIYQQTKREVQNEFLG